MSAQVQELIDKIKNDGVNAAEQKATEIESEANKRADQIILEANNKAEQIILNAQEEVKRMKESTIMALQQSSRDTLISLRKSIETMLQGIIVEDVKGSLSADNLATMITEVVKNSDSAKKSGSSLEVVLSQGDLDKLKSSFVSKLQKQVKGEINVESSDDIGNGFTISYDGGKSSFDFSDEALAQYLSTFLNSQISSIVQESAK